MKIKKTEAVALLVALDFPKATTLDDKTLLQRVRQVPEKVDAADVPEAQKDLYDKLVAAKGDIELDGAVAAKDDEQKGRKSRVDKAVDKAAADKKKAAAKNGKKDAKPAAAKNGEKKTPRKERTEVAKDEYGSVVGSDRAKINAAFPRDWATIEDIAEAAGVDLKKTKSRLRRARRQGHLEVQKIVQYRLKPAKK